MTTRTCLRGAAALLALFAIIHPVFAEGDGTALVRHAPTLNGVVEGSIQQMTAESVTLNGGAGITGDLLIPGEPTVRLNGRPTFGGTISGAGAATPVNHTVTLNGSVQLRNLRTRVDGVAMATVAAPPAPTGTRTVALNSKADAVGDFATVRALTANGNLGQIVVPAGAYGDFTANGNSGFTLGVAGGTTPAVYSFQRLTLNGNGTLQVVGPVVITLANGVTANGGIGSSANPEWLALRIATGGVTLNGNVTLCGYVNAPSGSVIINGNSRLIGGLVCDRLTVNGNGLLRLINASPTVAVTSPASGFVATAPIPSLTLAASAADADGSIAKVEFYSGAMKLGESTTPPYQFTWTTVPAGTFSITARATDNAGATTTSAPVTVIANQPPVVSLTAPVSGAVFAPPAQVTLSATASDLDGTVARVEFFRDGMKVGESTATPYQLSLTGLPLGTYKFFARASDDRGVSSDSSVRSVVVEAPPTVTVRAPASVVRGASIVVTASASDPDGTVAKVEFYRGSKLVGTVTTPSGNPPVFAFTDTEVLLPGSYAYTARSYDNQGLFTDSAVSTVAVLATLPYVADFEAAEGYALGPISTQLGWTATGNGAAITDQSAANGVRSIALAPGTPPVRVAQAFGPYPGHDVVFVDFFARPVAQVDVANSTTFDVEGARFAFARTGVTAVLNAFDGDGTGGGVWRPTAFSVPVGSDAQLQSWTRLTARLDFGHKTWDLYAAGNMVGADLKLREGSATYLASFAVRGDASTVSRLDYIFAGADNPLFADVNNNGIDDAWETAHGMALTSPNRMDDSDGDGITTLNEYLGGTDPRDYYNGVAPTLSIASGDKQSAPPGTFNPEPLVIAVRRADGTPLANAPVSFVVSDGGGLSLTAGATETNGIVRLRTGVNGIAQVWFKQPLNAGAVSHITATAGVKSATFESRALDPNKPPVVEITSPIEGATLLTSAPIVLQASASDADGTVSKVAFYVGNQLIGEAVAPPYMVAWQNAVAGDYVLTAIAIDDAEAKTTSQAVRVHVASAPPIALTSPAENAHVTTTDSVLLTASLSGGMAPAKVGFLVDDVLVGEVTEAPYIFSWESPALGAHGLIARATAADGTSIDSPRVHVVVEAGALFGCGFEASEGYATGPLSAHDEWSVWGAGEAIVTANDAATGTQALMLSNGAVAGQTLYSVATDVLFADFRAKLRAGDDTASGFFKLDNIALALRKNPQGRGELYITINDGWTWVTTGIELPLAASEQTQQWVRFTVRKGASDYSCDLYVDGKLVTADLHGYISWYPDLELLGPTTGSTLIDALAFYAENPLFTDVDKDGMDDAWEREHGLDPTIDDRTADPDGDGLTNGAEFLYRTNPHKVDTDADGFDDAWEIANGLDPTKLVTPEEMDGDADHDGLTLRQEIALGTKPNVADTDGDGIPDGWEVAHQLNPKLYESSYDPDGDGLSNLEEYRDGTDLNDYYNGVKPVITTITGDGTGSADADGRWAVKVTKPDGTAYVNAPVHFSVTEGTGLFATTPTSTLLYTSLTVHTDSNGVAAVYLKGGEQ